MAVQEHRQWPADRQARDAELADRSENDILGFHVLRIAKNRRGIVNRALIPAKALGSTRGSTYRFVDRNARPGVANTYQLQVVSKDGLRAFKASTTVRVRH
jgi:hypothetical protein